MEHLLCVGTCLPSNMKNDTQLFKINKQVEIKELRETAVRRVQNALLFELFLWSITLRCLRV